MGKTRGIAGIKWITIWEITIGTWAGIKEISIMN